MTQAAASPPEGRVSGIVLKGSAVALKSLFCPDDAVGPENPVASVNGRRNQSKNYGADQDPAEERSGIQG
jgi:hypothetical protein